MIVDTLAALCNVLTERRKELANMIVSGSCSDFPAYRGLCGEIRGIDVALSHIDDLRHRLVVDDDDAP